MSKFENFLVEWDKTDHSNRTVSKNDDDVAREHGATIEPIMYRDSDKVMEYKAVSVKTGKVLRRGTIEWVKAQLKQHNIPVKSK